MQHKGANNELYVLAHTWLSLVGHKISAAYCKEAIAAHPDYPALTALTDFLESGGMEYEAVQADASYIHEFGYPLLAHIRQPGNERLQLITDAGIWEQEKELTKNWSGIVLYAVEGSVWRHEENDQLQRAAQKNKRIAAALILASVAVFAASVFLYAHWMVNLFGLLSLVGLVISIAVLGAELGYQSELVKQVCGTVGNGGCEKVLKSKSAKGVAGITPADASVLYFATQLLGYLAGCVYPALFSGIISIGFSGIAVAIWSIYTQAVKLKEWCALCLCIVGVLLLQSVISLISFGLFSMAGSYIAYTAFVLTAALLTLAFIPLKQLIKTNSHYRNELALLNKWKTDASLFLSQLEAEPSADTTVWENDLLIGNAEAPVRITVACNPYCGPCAKAHEALDAILEMYSGKISVQVRLLCNAGNEKDKRTIAVKAILRQAAAINSNAQLQAMLADWFHWMDLEKWQKQWSAGNAPDVTPALLQHEAWMHDAGIIYTPTFFINGRRMPGRYQLIDLKKLIPQLAGSFAIQ